MTLFENRTLFGALSMHIYAKDNPQEPCSRSELHMAQRRCETASYLGSEHFFDLPDLFLNLAAHVLGLAFMR